ncbi:MAG TPA: hypothetical protein GXZ67_06930 [Clostridiaceae bacterium]|nr:hypothetical protein [Clostridiaceae bacterium]
MSTIKNLSNALLLSGALIAGVGMYLVFAKAGLPFQDAPPELVGRYMAFQESGEICLAVAGVVFLIGIIGHIIRKVSGERQKQATG